MHKSCIIKTGTPTNHCTEPLYHNDLFLGWLKKIYDFGFGRGCVCGVCGVCVLVKVSKKRFTRNILKNILRENTLR